MPASKKIRNPATTMTAKTITGTSPEEILVGLRQSLADGFKPTMAVVFISIKQDRKAVIEILEQEGVAVFGATTSGEFNEKDQTSGGISVMLVDMSKDDYLIVFEPIADRTLEEVTASLARQSFTKFKKPALILCSTLLTANGEIIDGNAVVGCIESSFGSGINMFGGMAGDDISFTGTYVFTHKQETDKGLVALVLDEEKISLTGVAISGWKPMGVARTVTSSEANLVYTIDHHPALEIYLRFLGKDASTADDQVNFFESITVHYPFLIEREGMEPKICGPIGYDKEKKALICESNLAQGSRFRFSSPPDFEIIDAVVAKAQEIKNESHAAADALLVFSCAGRLSSLGPLAQQENEGLQQVWNVPMAGFYTYGEFGKGLSGKHDFHSTTNSWVALKEK